MTEDPHDDGTVLIKKYGNRRLYDTRRSRYITLEQLARIVQEGATVRVVDAAGGKDLTRQVLTQVILERQDALNMIPAELLHVILRTQGTFEQAPFAAFLSAFTRHVTSTSQAWTQPFAHLLRGLAGAAARATERTTPHDASPSAPEPEAASDDGDGLRSRIETLLRKIAKP